MNVLLLCLVKYLASFWFTVAWVYLNHPVHMLKIGIIIEMLLSQSDWSLRSLLHTFLFYFGILNVYSHSVWPWFYSGVPSYFGSPSAVEALRQHRQWLVNFQRDISMISSAARYSHTVEPLCRVTNDLESQDQYPLFNVR